MHILLHTLVDMKRLLGLERKNIWSNIQQTSKVSKELRTTNGSYYTKSSKQVPSLLTSGGSMIFS